MQNKKRALRMFSVLVLALVMVCGACITAFAAADTPSLDFNEKGSITLTLYSDEAEAVVTDGELTLYEVAELYLDDGNMAYAYTEAFVGCGAPLDDVTAATLADTLAGYAENNDIAGIQTAEVSSDGKVAFSDLSLGLFLIIQTTQSEGYYTIDPFLVTVPLAGENSWIYDVDASPKVEIYPEPAVPEEPTPETPTPSGGTLPQTGQLVWPIPILAVAGVLFCIAGARMRRRGERKEQG